MLLVPVGVIYGRLTARIPSADSEIGYTSRVLPTGASFAAGWIMTYAYLVVCPFEAVAVGELAAQIFPALQQCPLYRVGGYDVTLPKLLLDLTVVAAITAVNIRGVRQGTALQDALTFGLIAIFLVFSTLGVRRGNLANLRPFFAQDDSPWGPLNSTWRVLQVVPYFLAGFEAVSRCSEERSSQFSGSNFTRVTVGALVSGAFFYATVIIVVALLSPWQELIKSHETDGSFVTLAAFKRAFGSDWIVDLILIGAILSLLKVFNGCLLSSSRLIFAMGRSGFIPRAFAFVHPRFSTPVWAVAMVGLLAALGCFLGKAILVPITNVGSICFTVGWMLTSLAYLRGAGGDAPNRRALGSAGLLVTAALVLMKLIPQVPDSFTRWEYCALLAWGALGLALWGAGRVGIISES
jgi:amino acid transporter